MPGRVKSEVTVSLHFTRLLCAFFVVVFAAAVILFPFEVGAVGAARAADGSPRSDTTPSGTAPSGTAASDATPSDITRSDITPAPRIDEIFVVGKVKSMSVEAVDDHLLSKTGIISRRQLVEVEIREGPLAGSTVVVRNEITDNPAYNVTVKPGDEVILSVTTENGGKPEINIADHHRVPVLAGLLALFLACFLWFGGKQGDK